PVAFAGDVGRGCARRWGAKALPSARAPGRSQRRSPTMSTDKSLDTFKCKRVLKVGSRSYEYFSLPEAEKNGLGGISHLPLSLKVLLENLLRHEDGRSVTADDIAAIAEWLAAKTSTREIAYRPSRVLMQDFTG